MNWNLYQKGEFLAPLKFSNGKTQEDVVKEVLKEIDHGKKVIFIKGICGTGKSAIALNIARDLGKTSIVVPGKNLQNQYKKDYENNKYVLKPNKGRLKISVITGRNNHQCQFLRDDKAAVPIITKEVNSKLHDIFESIRKGKEKEISGDFSADRYDLPCKVEIKEKNWNKIKKYLKQNKKDLNDFEDIKDVKRASIASVCPYWSPVISNKYELKQFSNTNQREYEGLDGKKFIFYQRKEGCKFYEQFNSFIDSDVIVFNSLKYKLESALNRKPSTQAEIIDECDEFLDSFSNQRNINIDRLQNSLVHLFSDEEGIEDLIREISEIIKSIKRKYVASAETREIISLKETGVYDLFRIILKHPELLDEADDESYVFDVEESARMFEGFLDESYITYTKQEGNLIVSVVTTNLAKKFQEMVNKNKVIVLMSGTIHSEEVLKNIFGIYDFSTIDAETEQQGRIEVQKTGLEMDCRYSNFSSSKHTREDYLRALSKCVEVSKKPTLVHVNSFMDLPDKEEITRFNIKNLISREELRDIQREDKTGNLIEKFKLKLTDVLFSTRAARGIDFPGDECNSIIFTKYPNPNVQDAFWRILNKTKPQHYWSFYKDKAKRELWQKIYRGLRFKEDHVFVLSPDIRVLESFL